MICCWFLNFGIMDSPKFFGLTFFPDNNLTKITSGSSKIWGMKKTTEWMNKKKEFYLIFLHHYLYLLFFCQSKRARCQTEVSYFKCGTP